MTIKHSKEYWLALTPPEIGKETENMVASVFRFWNNKVGFAYHRLPDTKASRGGMVAKQPADYMYRCGTHAGFIEVKALAHSRLLPNKNVSQLPTLHKWCLAGSDDVVLVHQYLEGMWRAIDPRRLAPGAASWDVTEFQAFTTPDAALKSTGYFQL
jgi:hypothetical protein